MGMVNRTPYPTDLTDAQWNAIKPLFSNSRVYVWPKRELVNATLYLVDNGCKWRNLPHDFPPYSTVHSFYRRARLSGLWDKILLHLVEVTRQNAKRKPTPGYAIVDSQSVKTTSASDDRGIDGGKKIKGRKRHIAVDVMGNLLAIVVHPANQHDTMTGLFPALGAYTLYPTIKAFCADAGYRGTFEDEVMEMMRLPVDMTARNEQKRWEILPNTTVVTSYNYLFYNDIF